MKTKQIQRYELSHDEVVCLFDAFLNGPDDRIHRVFLGMESKPTMIVEVDTESGDE